MRDRSIALVVRGDRILSVLTCRSFGLIRELPGGGIEPGETPEAAALRELKEECGLDGSIVRPLNVLHWKDGSTEYVFLIKVSDAQEAAAGFDPETAPGREQAIRDVRWLRLKDFSERERAFLWSWGLLDVEGFFDIAAGWGNEVSCPGEETDKEETNP